MASVAEVRAALDGATHTITEAQGGLQAVKEHIEQARGQALAAAEGSGHDAVITGNAHLGDAGTKVDEALQVLQAAIESYQQYAAAL